MKKTVAIVQSNYIPWRGYFDLIGLSDEFIILDTVQFTKNDWRNRNKIKTANGVTWLTIPVVTSGRFGQTIDETRISDRRWAKRHAQTISESYRRAACFDQTAPWLLERLDEIAEETLLGAVNEHLLRSISARLGLTTLVRRSSDVIDRSEMLSMDPSQRVLALCQAARADRYLSGPAAKPYLDERIFVAAGIAVEWMDYSGYSDYPQLWGPFDGRLSIVDLLLNTGTNAPNYLKCR